MHGGRHTAVLRPIDVVPSACATFGSLVGITLGEVGSRRTIVDSGLGGWYVRVGTREIGYILEFEVV